MQNAVHPAIEPLLKQIKRSLEERFGPRLRGIVLYGSYARGEATDESDLDLMILLEPADGGANDHAAIWQAIYPVQLQVPDLTISPRVVAPDVFERGEFAIYRAAKREGIVL